MFLLWELSTPFVYARWFLHKAGMSRTTAYKVNGVLMVLVFFLCRNVAGLGKVFHSIASSLLYPLKSMSAIIKCLADWVA